MSYGTVDTLESTRKPALCTVPLGTPKFFRLSIEEEAFLLNYDASRGGGLFSELKSGTKKIIPYG